MEHGIPLSRWAPLVHIVRISREEWRPLVAVVRVRYYISKARFDGPERARVMISKKPIFLRPPQCIPGYKYLKTAICPRGVAVRPFRAIEFYKVRSARSAKIQFSRVLSWKHLYGPHLTSPTCSSDENTCRSRNSRVSQSYVSRCMYLCDIRNPIETHARHAFEDTLRIYEAEDGLQVVRESQVRRTWLGVLGRRESGKPAYVFWEAFYYLFHIYTRKVVALYRSAFQCNFTVWTVFFYLRAYLTCPPSSLHLHRFDCRGAL